MMTTLAALSASDWITLGIFAAAQVASLLIMVAKLDKSLSLLGQRFDYLSESLTKDMKVHDDRIDQIESHVFRRPAKSRNVMDT